MSLLQGSEIQSSVYVCTFLCLVRQAEISMKFPCSYFVEWTTTGGKSTANTSKHKPQKNHVSFNEKMNLTTEMIYDHKTQEYTKKDALTELFLVSKSRPDQNKLVGRVTVDLAKITNVQMYAEPTEFKLNFCSVEASLTMQFMLVEQKLTSMKVQDLDRSSFIDYISQISLKNQKNMPPNLKVQEPLPKQKSVVSNNDQAFFNQPSLGWEANRSTTSVEKKEIIPQKNGTVLKSKVLQSNIEEQVDKVPFEQSPQFSAHKRVTFGHQYLVSSNTHDPEQKNDHAIDKFVQNKHFEPQEDLKLRQTPQYKMIAEQVKEPDNPLESQQSNTEIVTNTLPDTFLEENHYEIIKPEQNLRRQQKMISIQKTILEQRRKQKNKDLSQEIQQMNSVLEEQMSRLKQEYKLKQQSLIELNQKHIKDAQDKTEVINQLNSQLSIQSLTCKKMEMLLVEKENIIKDMEMSFKQEEEKNREIILRYKSELQQVDSRYTNYQEEIEKLNKNLIEQESRVQLYEEKFMSHEQTIKNLEDKLLKEEQHKLLHEQKETQLQDTIKKLQQELKACQREQKNSILSVTPPSTDEIQALKEKESAYECKIKELQAELDVTLQQYEQKKDDYQILNKKYNDITLKDESEKSEKIDLNSQGFNQTQEEIIKLNSQLQFLRISLQMAEKQSKQLNEEIQTLNSQNNNIKLECEKLEIKCIDLQSKLSPTPQLGLHPESFTQFAQEKLVFQEQLMKYSTLLNEASMKNTELTIQNERYAQKINSLQRSLQLIESENIKLKQKHKKYIKEHEIQHQTQSETQSQWEKKCLQYEERIDNLNLSLQEKKSLNNELSETVIKFMEKEAKMKQTLTILEDQSKQIFILFQEKEHNQETYQKMIEDLQREIERIKTNFDQIHSEESSPNKKMFQSPKTPLVYQEDREDSLSNIQNINLQLQEELEKLRNSYSLLKNQHDSIQDINNDYERLKVDYELRCKNEQQLRINLQSLKLQNAKEIQKLNQQLVENMSFNEQKESQAKRELQRALKDITIQLQILKNRQIQYEESKANAEGQLQEIRMEIENIQEEKFGLQSQNNQKDIKILELEEELYNLTAHLQSLQENPPTVHGQSQQRLEQMYSVLTLIKDKLVMSNMSLQWDELMKSILERSLLGGEEIAKIINIEEKSRLLSKELQKLKAQIMKSSSRNQQEKLNFMSMIKKCEQIISELVAAAESLNLNQSSFL